MVPVSEQTFTYDDIKKMDQTYLPMPVFAFNPSSFFTFGVSARTTGDWSHFMWMIEPGVFASQGWYFGRKTIDDYKKYILKFVYNPAWTPAQKKVIMGSLLKKLAKPHWQTRYDVLALLGHLVGLKWIQSGRFEICSDDAARIKMVDQRYDLKDPLPADVNEWMKKWRFGLTNPNGYLVLGRYFGRD